MTPTGILNAGLKGPNAFMSYFVNNGPPGMSIDDGWRQATMMLALPFLVKGNAEGAQRAQEFMFQLAHVGSNQAMMQGYAALQAGDYQGAAQLLAKAYAFFPDGGSIVLQPTSKGLFGQRYNAATGQPNGTPFQVTPQTVAGLLNQTTDPQQWARTLVEEQNANSLQEHRAALNQHYQNNESIATARIASTATNASNAQNQANYRAGLRETGANERRAAEDAAAEVRRQEIDRAAMDRAQLLDSRTRDIAAQRLQEQQQIKDQQIQSAVNLYYPQMGQGVDANTAQESGYFANLVRNGYTAPQAKEMAQELMKGDGQYQLRDTSDGGRAVVSRDNPDKPVAFFTPGMSARLAYPHPGPTPGENQGQQSPIGGAPAPPPPLTTPPTPPTLPTQQQTAIPG